VPSGERASRFDYPGNLCGHDQSDTAFPECGKGNSIFPAIGFVSHPCLTLSDLINAPSLIPVPLHGIHGQIEVRIKTQYGFTSCFHGYEFVALKSLSLATTFQLPVTW
jgi:hypothetical protein